MSWFKNCKGGTPIRHLFATNLTFRKAIRWANRSSSRTTSKFKEHSYCGCFLGKTQDETFISVCRYPNLLGSLPAKDSGVRYRLEGYSTTATYTVKKDSIIYLKVWLMRLIGCYEWAMSPYYATIKEKNLTVNELLNVLLLIPKRRSYKTEDHKKI